MSVINQMLQNLDKQPKQTADADYPILEVEKKLTSKFKPLDISIIFLLISIAAILGWYFYFNQATKVPMEAKHAEQNPAIIPVESKVQEPVSEAKKPTNIVQAVVKAKADTSAESTTQAPKLTPPSTLVEPKLTPSQTKSEPNKPSKKVNNTANSQPKQKSTAPAKAKVSIAATTKTPEEIAQNKFNQAKEALSKGLFVKSEQLLKQALNLKPDFHQARITWMSIRYGEQNYPSALSILQQGIQAYPEHLDYPFLAARILTEIEQPDAAWQLIANRTPEISMHSDFYQFKALLAQQTENWQPALTTWQELLGLNPNQSNWLLGAAIAADQIDKTQDAIHYYQLALSHSGLSQASLEFAQQRLLEIQP
ncbi:hypothetical protein [Catenovulum maritimum]|uniref:Uncharacterized protein n=1 Tax=Catenovulum maritimum TaxID=1513271 RepID=A0A0J8GZ88_9ALTE|nr:hypothetical protein [Catenovulum maritimum]KMT66033.1 hypothetical protein XM47_06180 [Catenovulum maritimum]